METILTNEEMKKMAEVVREVELKTSAEVRLMIVGSSTATAHAPIFLWTILIALAGIVYWGEAQFFEHHIGFWLWPSTLVATGLVAKILTNLPQVRRWLASRADMDEQVWRRAELEFYREGLTETAGSTGVLVFISLLERQAVVLGDKAISMKLPPSTWDQMVSLILEGARTGQWAKKLEEALRLCGSLLAQHFPIQPGDQNELADHVIVKQ